MAMGAIFAYVVLWTIVWKQTYLILETPTGTVRLNPQAPKTWSKTQDLNYCTTANRTMFGNFTTQNCTFWDEALDIFPQALDNTITVTTRVTKENQALNRVNCTLRDPTCSWVNTATATDFVADVEKFTILVDHAYFAPTVNIKGSARQLPGRLIDSNGDEMYPPPPNQIGVPGQYDILEIGTFLKAANVDLNGPCEFG